MPSRKLYKRSKPKRSKANKKSKNKKSVTKSSCQNSLKRKIAINMDEYKKGKFVSRQQAIAVSYSQVKKSRPGCSRYFRRK